MDASGQVLSSVNTGSWSLTPPALAVHPADGRAWIAIGDDLFLIDEGAIVSEIALDGDCQGIALDPSANVIWVSEPNQLVAIDHTTATPIGAPIPSPGGSIDDIAVDPLGDLWVATDSGLFRGLSGAGPGSQVSPHAYDHLSRRIGGGVWASQGSNVTGFLADGSSPWSAELFYGLGQIQDLVENPETGTVWVANQVSLAEVDSLGAVVRYLLLSPAILIRDLDIAVDARAPTIEFVSPDEGASLATDSPELALSYSDAGVGINPESIQLSIDGTTTDVTCDADPAEATCTVSTPLGEGPHTLAATIRDRAGNLSEPAELTITVDLTPPQISLTSPQGGTITNAPSTVTLAGSVSESAAVDVNGTPVTVAPDLTFSHSPLSLGEGANLLSIVATDEAGNHATVQITVTVDTVPPPPVAEALVSVDFTGGSATINGAAGAAEAGATIQATNTRTGEVASAAAAGDGSFSVTLTAIDGDLVELTVVDLAGNVSSAITVELSSPVTPSCNEPPDPATVAPEVDATVSYDMFEANRFLWEGAPPVQAGVTADAITSERIILIQGRVLDENGEPLPGVKVTVKDHPEFGCTSTRIDGHFDLAANGGGPLIIRFDQDGYFAVDRREDTFGRQYYHLDDVVMTQIPDESHQVALGQGDAQFFSAPTVTDAGGSRATAFVVPAGTQASLRFADGTTQPVSSLTVRVKEYTVGEDGPEAMPAALPPSSGYTYAFEATADEALTAGAVSVDFSQPLFHYVENFLDFPVGEYVPTAYYDKQAGAWVASGNGIVVEILSVDGEGRAVLDFDGDGVAEDAAFLLENEVTDGELTLVAGQYAFGQTLWRVPIPHFTPWDCNWPYGPPEDAEPPPDDAVDQEPDPDDNDVECGSIIDCQSQNLRERIPVAGTPYSLVYNSAFTPGKKSNRQVNVRLLDEDIPASVEFVQVKVEVAGQRTAVEFPIGSAPAEWSYEWNGLDSLGRPVIGETEATVKVGYGYDSFYQSAWNPNEVSTGGGGGGGSGRVSSLLSFGRTPTEFEIIGTREGGSPVVLQRTYTKLLRNLDARAFGFGGWDFGQHYLLDISSHSVLGGGGPTRSATHLVTNPVLVEGTHLVHLWQAGTWVPTYMTITPIEIELLPSGEILFSTFSNRIFRRTLDGQIYHLAGNGDQPTLQDDRFYWDFDGDLAVTVPLGTVASIQAGPGGSLYIADRGSSRVLKIEPDGRIYSIRRHWRPC